MRVNVNLSRRPFSNHRPFYLAVLVLFFMGLWLLLSAVATKSEVSARADELTARVRNQEARVEEARRLQAERQKEVPQVVISEPDAIQLANARQMIARKAFKWNRLIGDIENYVPNETRILSIEVKDVVARGSLAASVQIKAAGRNAGQMTEMMEKLEKSGGLFSVVQASQEATDDSGLIPFTLNLSYNAQRGGL